MTIHGNIAANADTFVALRRDLHSHPELGLEEVRTSGIVASLLEGWGYRVTTGIAKTGVVGTLTNGTSRRSIGIRADMDALPIVEETGLPYASRTPGLMHACGHDGHTSMLLAAARYLAETRNFNGTVHLIFQPAEENFGGARIMMDEGLFMHFPCDAIFGLHNIPGFAENRLGFHPGPFMASVEEIQVTLIGKGGHGAEPHLTNDPIVAGASLIMALQTIVSRNINPLDVGIVTVGGLKAGEVCNVIPERAWMTIGVRAFSREVRATLVRRLREIVHGQASTFGMTAEIVEVPGYPVLVNDPAMTDFARAVGVGLLGEENVEDLTRPTSGGEDFAFFLEKRPGTFFLLGQGTETDRKGLHHPGFDFNDRTLVTGASFWCALVERFLAEV
jgi:hippurate hydrolase